jgi:hypothetical protein
MTFTPDTAIAFSAAFVALLSLFVSIWQLKVQRRFNRNALRPLPWFYIQNGDDEFYVDLYNDGPGPLIIASTSFELNGKTHPHLHCLLPDYGGSEYKVLSPGKIIGAGKEVRLWYQPFASPSAETEEQIEAEGQIEIQEQIVELKEYLSSVNAIINYQDVYDDVYTHKRSFDFLKQMKCSD